MALPVSAVSTAEVVKAWRSVTQNRWLIQVEHDLPERGGWIRAWLVSADTGLPRTWASLAEAEVVMANS